MIRHFGAKVVYLRRVNLGGVPLDESLAEGSYRELTPEELAILKR
jgi:16S rRNA pseudouridine516 synthase